MSACACPDCRAIRAALDAAQDEIAMLRRGGKTLGEIIDRQGRELIELTDSQDIIGEDGDGDWEVVWDRLHEMKRVNKELTRQRDDARDLVARSGYFIDCEKGPGRDCVMWHSAGRHEGHASEAVLDEVRRQNGGAS